MKIVLLGLSITSSWGNGHATNFRALTREMVARGHTVTFCERDVPWYRDNADLPRPGGVTLCLYGSLSELASQARAAVAEADLVIQGSYVPEGVAVADWVADTAQGVNAFYDIDTPITVAQLMAGEEEYLARRQLSRFDLYLSFTGGPTLERLAELGVRRPRAFFCLVDPELVAPLGLAPCWALGYLGTYSADRQPAVEELLLRSARALPGVRFALAGPQYPESIAWPENLDRVDHIPPAGHARFLGSQRFTLNVTRAAMRRAGHSPSVRLFEAAAAGTAVISDRWPGLEEIFVPGREILLVTGAEDVTAILRELPDADRAQIAAAARARVLAEHTPARRVDMLEAEVAALGGAGPQPPAAT